MKTALRNVPFSAYEAQERLMLAAGLDADITEAVSPAGLKIDDLVYENCGSVRWSGDHPSSLGFL